MESLNILEVYEFLRKNMYILARGQDRILSKKFNDELEAAQKGLPMRVVSSIAKAQTPPPFDYAMVFMNFIIKAKVPKEVDNGDGRSYEVNKYNEKAAKEFQRMIEKEKISLAMIVKSTALYYASHRNYKKKIGNYILDGDWRTDYLELSTKAETSEEALKDHINQEINGNHHNPWT